MLTYIHGLRPLFFSACATALVVGCNNAPDPTPRSSDLRVAEEVYRMFCKRVARGEYPGEPTGTRFNAPCEGTAGVEPSAGPAGVRSTRLEAMVSRRPPLVAALDQVFGAAPIPQQTETFQTAPGDQGELDRFLANLIPFYDDGTAPASTRAIAAMAKQLATPTDPRARAVLQKLSELSTRRGYRAPDRTLAATAPMLAYPRIDEVSERLLALLGKGGAGNGALLSLLQAAALELADDSKNIANSESSLRVLANLAFRALRQPGVGRPADADDSWQAPLFPETRAVAPLYYVKRGDDGRALAQRDSQGAVLPGGDASPFPVAGSTDASAPLRDASGRVPGITYGNATETVLAALLREQRPLLARSAPGAPSTVEKLLRGLRPLLGTMGARDYTFTSGRSYRFDGPNVGDSPLVDLIHAGATLLQAPETERLLVLLSELLDKYESDANGTVYAALAVDRLADADSTANLLGWDGTPNTPSDFWDDLIDVGMRIVQRPGQLEAVMRAFAQPSAVAQTSLLAKFMQYKDQVTYTGAPLRVGSDGKYTAEDAAKLNAPITTQLSVPVDRATPGADIAMNRSLFQRLVSTIRATNGAEMCNRGGASLLVAGPLGTLTFPNADPLQMLVAGCAEDPAHTGKVGYGACSFVNQPNGAVTHIRSIIGLGEARIQDSQLQCAAKFNNQDIGVTQETDSQIVGFTLKPTPEAIARYVMAPRTQFITRLFDPLPTVYGVPLVQYEPDFLFALEAKQNDILLDGSPASFLDASIDLTHAFDDHEPVTDTGRFDQPAYPNGYMFAELLSTLGDHWPSPRSTDCPAAIAPGDEGCTQRLDPSKNFYAKQSNLVSYEPLLIKAIQEERLGALLQQASARLTDVWVGSDARGAPAIVPANTPGAADGMTVLADFVRYALTPRAGIADRRGVTATHTNTCTPSTDASGQTVCQDGRGRVVPQTTPLYLLLDALNAIDAVWARPENAERHSAFLQGRSELVDRLLTVDRDDALEPASYRMHNQRGRALGITLIAWLRSEVLAKHAAPDARIAWATGADGLARRVSNTLSHPMVAAGLDLFDAVWADAAAGDEMAALNAYLMDDENNEPAFTGLLLAAADALEFIDKEPGVAPVIQFAALAVAPNAFAAIGPGAEPPQADKGAVYTALEFTRSVALLPAYRGMAPLSPISKLLKNAAITPPGGVAPLIVLFDAIADVNRSDPQQASSVPLSPEDNQRVFDNLTSFMSDSERGLERLYTVISGRYLDESEKQP